MTIKEAREFAGITQQQVFEQLNVPIRTLNNYEHGKRECPKWVEALLVQAILNLKKG